MLICFVIIILLVLLLFILLINNKNTEKKIIEDEESMGIGEFSEDIKEQIDYSEWFQVGNCINQYLNTININNDTYFSTDENNNLIKTVEDEDIKAQIFSLLSESYINKNNITKDNVYDLVETINHKQVYTILNIRKVVNDNSNQYITQGFIQENNTFKGEKNFIVNFDLEQYIFSIEPLESSIEIENINVSDTVIEKNEINSITIVSVTIENVIKEYLNTLKNTMLYYPEKAYTYLDEEYREKRFGTEEKFIDYINENKELIKTIRLEKYEANQNEEDTQYICIDQYENYYIFNDKYVLDYTAMLDVYTLDLPEFLEQYNSTNNQGKTALNIQKFFQAINAKDYTYAYSKLADSFKNNYFKTEEEFENYVRNTFFSFNEVEYVEFSVEGDVNVYNIMLTDLTDASSEQLSMNIIMQLGEGTDFVMSFGT